MSNQPSKSIPINALRAEPSSAELVNSENMKPYMNLLIAEMGGRDTEPALEALAAVPLEQRYVWRVMSALKWGLCDLESTLGSFTTASHDSWKATHAISLNGYKFSFRLPIVSLQHCYFAVYVL